MVDKSGSAAYLLRQLYQKHLQDFEAAVRADGGQGKQGAHRGGHSLADASVKPLDIHVAAAAELLAVLKEDGETAVFDLPLTDALTEPAGSAVSEVRYDDGYHRVVWVFWPRGCSLLVACTLVGWT